MPLVNAHYPQINPYWLHAGSPSVYAETIPKILAAGDLAIAATGVELAVMVPLVTGTVVTSITFITGGTALATGTAGYAVLRDSAGAKLAQTADFTSTARAANTEYTVTLSSAYTVTATGAYRIGISFTASTIPTLRGVSLGNAAVAASGTTIAVTHGSSVGGTAPSTVATPSNAAVLPYFRIS
jgi:hypothetical protein